MRPRYRQRHRGRRLVVILMIALALAAHCRHRRPESRCERAIAGLDAHLARGAILWFGELHGTEESPRFAGDAACLASRVARVQLGLEIPSDEQPRIDRFLRSAGDAADRAALLDGPFWRVHDGRSSVAMLALIDRVRALRAAGAAIDIVAYDDPWSPADRDEGMADRIARARDPGAIVVALSGNLHARRTDGSPWDPDFVPAVAHLLARGFDVTTFDAAANGGTFWACIADGPDEEPRCGVQDNWVTDRGEPWTLGPSRTPAYDGVYRVGKTVASPPARP